MQLISSAFEDNGFIPQKYTCEGKNISPPLLVAQLPETTQSIALVVSDPDAPSVDFVHWLVWNIDPAHAETAEGDVFLGAVEGLNGFGRIGWGGPCPPFGAHRYVFEAYALDSMLELSAPSTKTDLLGMLNGRIVDKAQLIGLYELQNS